MIYRFKGMRLNTSKESLAASIVAINQLNMRLQRLSAALQDKQAIRETVEQMAMECYAIREIMEPPKRKKSFWERFTK